MKRLRNLVGGLADAAFAALCTFSVGLTAVRMLPDAGVALFSLMLTGYIIGMILPRSLIFNHLEISANQSSEVFLPQLRHSIQRAALPLALAVIVALGSGVPVLRYVTPMQYTYMAMGAGVAVFTGALLAHVRAAMHLVGLHALAGGVSLANFCATITTIFVGRQIFGGDLRWALPFAAMVTGQCVGMLLWLFACRVVPVARAGSIAPLPSRILNLVPVTAGQLAIFVQSTLVVRWLGPAESAHLEGARVAASPVYILAAGLGALVVPPLVRHMSSAPVKATMWGLGRGMVTVGGAGLVYSAVLMALGPLLSLALGRQVDPLLAGARAGAFAVDGPATITYGMYIALKEFVRPAIVSMASAVLSIGVTVALLPLWGLYAVPSGQAVSALTQLLFGLLITGRGLQALHGRADNSRE